MKLFTASWCKFCKPVKQYIEENGLDVEIMDIDKNIDMALEYNISQIPALHTGNSMMLESENIKSFLKEYANAK